MSDYRRVFIDHLPSEGNIYDPNAPTDAVALNLIDAVQKVFELAPSKANKKFQAALNELDKWTEEFKRGGTRV